MKDLNINLNIDILETPNKWTMPERLDKNFLEKNYNNIKKNLNKILKDQIWTLSLRPTKFIDSAGLGLLINLRAYAQKNKISLKINYFSKSLQTLAQAQGVLSSIQNI